MATIAYDAMVKVLLHDLGITHFIPMMMYCDKKDALHIITNLIFYECTKYIELDCHFIRKKIQSDLLYFKHVSSTNQLAGVLTKGLG